MRACKACGVEKPVELFADAQRAGDHKRPQCIDCRRAYDKVRLEALNRRRDCEEFRAKRRVYLRKHVRDTPASRARNVRHVVRYRAKYPEKALARMAVQKALSSGLLVRPEACSRCGSSHKSRKGYSLIHGHHPDYSKPLEVVWLCVVCHNEEHRAEASKLEGEVKHGQSGDRSLCLCGLAFPCGEGR